MAVRLGTRRERTEEAGAESEGSKGRWSFFFLKLKQSVAKKIEAPAEYCSTGSGIIMSLPAGLADLSPERREALMQRRRREGGVRNAEQRLDRIHQLSVIVVSSCVFLFMLLLYLKLVNQAAVQWWAVFLPLFLHDLYMSVACVYRTRQLFGQGRRFMIPQ